MIIKGLFRRYERWNPVHPTVGAFWGMGVGVGCGVGWGPGFGPEVIGYVGAGCGLGFSVGLTVAGFGIGLPANSVIQLPFNVTVNGAENALSFARFTAKKYIGERWNQTAPGISAFTRTTQQKLTCLKENLPLKDGVDLSELIKSLSSRTRPALEHLNSLMNDHLSPITGSRKRS